MTQLLLGEEIKAIGVSHRAMLMLDENGKVHTNDMEIVRIDGPIPAICKFDSITIKHQNLLYDIILDPENPVVKLNAEVTNLMEAKRKGILYSNCGYLYEIRNKVEQMNIQ